MVKFSKEQRQEIIEKCALRDESGKKVYTQQELGNEYGTTRIYIGIISKGFKSNQEYDDHMARKNGFKSAYDRKNHWAKEKGFESVYKYRKEFLHHYQTNLESMVDE